MRQPHDEGRFAVRVVQGKSASGEDFTRTGLASMKRFNAANPALAKKLKDAGIHCTRKIFKGTAFFKNCRRKVSFEPNACV